MGLDHYLFHQSALFAEGWLYGPTGVTGLMYDVASVFTIFVFLSGSMKPRLLGSSYPKALARPF